MVGTNYKQCLNYLNNIFTPKKIRDKYLPILESTPKEYYAIEAVYDEVVKALGNNPRKIKWHNPEHLSYDILQSDGYAEKIGTYRFLLKEEIKHLIKLSKSDSELYYERLEEIEGWDEFLGEWEEGYEIEMDRTFRTTKPINPELIEYYQVFNGKIYA